MTFYRKYRPQKVDELDIAEVRESLSRIVKSGKMPQAFLFSGPKGTGKTSAARIIAKILNCDSTSLKLRGARETEPCNKCEQCISINKGSNIDVIELDAASHRGIEDVRSLRDAVNLSPAKARKKVYIIDEVHMLTLEASNALLKTLEEPPEHVFFVLATTNPEKLIETVRSRTTNIPFRKATDEEIVRSLARVVKGEKIKIPDASLQAIARGASGSFRDAVKTLEQLVSEGRKLDKEAVEEYLFQTKAINAQEIINLLVAKDTKKALEEVARISGRGGAMMNLLGQMIASFRESLLAKVGIGKDNLEKLNRDELLTLISLFSKGADEIRNAIIEELPVEIAIIKWCEGNIKNQNSNIKIEDISASQGPSRAETSGTPKQTIPAQTKLNEVSEEVWRTILSRVKPINTSIEALLRAAKPVNYEGGVLTLGVYYRFHKERLEDGHHRRILEDVVASVLGTPVRVVCTLTEPPAKEPARNASPARKDSVSGGQSDAGGKTVLTEGEDKDIIKIAEEIFGN